MHKHAWKENMDENNANNAIAAAFVQTHGTHDWEVQLMHQYTRHKRSSIRAYARKRLQVLADRRKDGTARYT